MKPSIIFMGTPEFAAFSLQQLVNKNYNVVATVTVPDRQAGRGRKIVESPVKQVSLKNDIPVLQPEKLKNPEFVDTLKSYNTDVFVVVAFRMLPEVIWSMPTKGTFNLHASLLPQYRGAAPINHAIINGEEKTGVTTFFIDKEIDTGNIIARKECNILPEETAGSLHDKLMTIGSDLICETIDSIENGNISTQKQDDIDAGQLRTAPKIFKEDCNINWNNDYQSIYNFIRGLSPYPAAWSTLKNDKEITAKIYFATPIAENHKYNCGKIITDQKSFLKVACQNGFIDIKEIHLAGKKRLKITDFLKGVKLNDDACFV